MLRVAGAVVLVAVAVAALGLGGTWMFLQTRLGGRTIAAVVLPRVNAAIAGRITLDRLAFGGDRLALENLLLRDPEGRPVLTVARVEVVFSPFSLLRRHLDIGALAIRNPRLTLVEEPGGLNLTRALGARPGGARPTPAAPTRSSSRWIIDLRGWQLSGGAVDYRSEVAGGGQAHVADIAMGGALRFADDHLATSATVDALSSRLDLRGDLALSPAGGLGAARVTLEATLPGATATARGRLDGENVDGAADLDARDLDALARSLAPLGGPRPPELSGRGRVELALAGSRAAPELRVAARFPSLRVDANRLRGLVASAVIPDLRVPEAIDLEVHAATASLGGHELRSPAVSVRATGAHLAASAHLAAPGPLTLTASGRRAGRVTTIERLSLRTPEASWSLLRPARLTLGPDRIALAGLALGAGAQRIEADVSKTPRRATGRLAIAALDLGRLPRALVPASLRLGGRLDANLRFDGRASAPEVEGSATVSGGRVRSFRDLALRLEARVGRGQARGRAELHGLGATLQARFDVPTTWPASNHRAPFLVDLQLAETDLGPTLQALAAATGGRPPQLHGRARISLRLDGSAAAPSLALDLKAQGLTFQGRPVGDVLVEARGNGDRPLEARVQASGPPAAPARVLLAISTPLSLRTILRHPPTTAALARAAIDVRGEVDRFPLASLARLSPDLPRLTGTLSLHLALSGTALAPEGSLAADVTGAAGERFPPTDARVELALGRNAIEARARVVRKGHPLLAATARLGAGPGDLRSPARLASAPLQIRAVLGPLTLHRRGLAVHDREDKARALDGIVHADLSVDGTADAPRAVLHVQAQGVRLDQSLVGAAEVKASYADRHAALEARLVSASGGTLQLAATTSADLGARALRHGLDPQRLPLRVRLDARGFELAALSGLTPELRGVGGSLTASVDARGTVSDPRVSGRLEWTAGTLTVSGFGDYRDIHLVLHGDERKLVLEELVARSSGGHARITGEAAPEAGHGYRLSAHAHVDRFPVYAQGQTVAHVSLDAGLRGRLGAGTDVAVDVAEARVELSDENRRNLQSLEVPRDVVLTENGTPRDRTQAAKLRALTEKTSAAAKPAPAHEAGAARIVVTAPRKLWITGNDARLELGLGPGFRVEVGTGVRVFGQVIVHRGRVDVLGRRFDLKDDSTLEWTGPPEEPDLNIRAQHDNRNENVTVLVTIKGRPGDTKIEVTSPDRPDLAQSQLYALIVTGHLDRSGGSGATGSFSAPSEAASLASGFVASRLQQTLARRLPFDVLTIDPGGGTTLTGTQFEAGRYVTDRLYVGYVGRIGADPARAQNRNAVHAEYRLSARWEIAGEYGDAGTGSADVFWKKSY